MEFGSNIIEHNRYISERNKRFIWKRKEKTFCPPPNFLFTILIKYFLIGTL